MRWRLFFLLLVLPWSSFAHKSCLDDVPADYGPWLKEETHSALAAVFASLPGPTSPKHMAWARQLRAALHPETGAGWTVIDLGPWLPQAPFEALMAQLPPHAVLPLDGTTRHPHGYLAQSMTVDDRGARRLSPKELELLRRFGPWTAKLLASAVAPDAVGVELTELRHGRAQVAASLWHLDGGDIGATLGFVGNGSEVLPGMPRLSHDEGQRWLRARDSATGIIVPRAQLLFFSALPAEPNRRHAVPTAHRTPAGDERRHLFVGRYRRLRRQ